MADADIAAHKVHSRFVTGLVSDFACWYHCNLGKWQDGDLEREREGSRRDTSATEFNGNTLDWKLARLDWKWFHVKLHVMNDCLLKSTCHNSFIAVVIIGTSDVLVGTLHAQTMLKICIGLREGLLTVYTYSILFAMEKEVMIVAVSEVAIELKGIVVIFHTAKTLFGGR